MVREKIEVDGLTFCEFLRRHNDGIISTERLSKIFYDTEDLFFTGKKNRLRLRSVEASNKPLQYDFAFKTESESFSAILANIDVARIIENPEGLKLLLPSSVRSKIRKEGNEVCVQPIVKVDIERRYLAIGELLVALDLCSFKEQRIFVVSWFHNDSAAGKELIAKEFAAMKYEPKFEQMSLAGKFIKSK